MVKRQQKISRCWRTSTGADHFLAPRAYLSTAAKPGRHLLDALTRLAAHDPCIPQAAGPRPTRDLNSHTRPGAHESVNAHTVVVDTPAGPSGNRQTTIE
jgi:hypothetical protein